MDDDPKTELPGESAGEYAAWPPPLDVEDYRADLKSFDLTADQERELLEALWQIMCAFVDLGFNLDAVQLVCGQKPEIVLADSENRFSVETNEQDAARRDFRGSAERSKS